jgi:hypothetical protein
MVGRPPTPSSAPSSAGARAAPAAGLEPFLPTRTTTASSYRLADRTGDRGLDEHLVSPSSSRADLTGLVLWHMNQLVSTGSQARLLIPRHGARPRTDGVVLFPRR